MFKAMLIKEFTLVLRDKLSLAALFFMPLLFILIMSLALKDTMNGERGILHYSVTDLSKSAESQQLQTFLEQNTFLTLDKAIPAVMVQLIIPKDFATALLQQEADTPLLLIDAAPDTKREMLLLFQTTLLSDIMRLRLIKIQEKIAPFMPDMASLIVPQNISPNSVIEVNYAGFSRNQHPNATQQSVPSWIVFGMFFVTIPMSTIFITERTQNTLMRMSSMNISIPVLFAGKVIPYLVINQIQMWLMIGCGIFLVPLFGGDPLTLGHSIAGLSMVSCGLSFAAIGTAALIAVLTATVEQATTIGGILNILFGAVGGVMVPKFYMPESMQKLSNISPMSWGLEGFLDIFLRNYGAEAVITESLALTGFGVILLLAAGFIFTYKTRL